MPLTPSLNPSQHDMYEDEAKQAQKQFEDSKRNLAQKAAQIADHEAAIANGTATPFNMTDYEPDEYIDHGDDNEAGDGDDRDEM